MNYQEIYNRIIARGQQRAKTRSAANKLLGYVEQHHIKPKCLGGNNKAENLVYLTAEEHFIVHALLVKIYPGNPHLVYALQMLTVENKDEGVKRPKNKLYGWMKKKIAKTRSELRTGSKHSKETKSKISESNKGKCLGRKLSEEHKAKISKSQIGLKRNLTDESRRRMSEAGKRHTGRKLSVEHRAAISAGGKGVKKSEETKAKMRKPKSAEHAKNISEARKRMFPKKL
jgi:hypothetical protein